MNPIVGKGFEERSEQAIGDPQLQLALTRATTRFIQLRNAAFAELSDPEGLRERGRAIKARTLEHLDEYLATFAEKAEKAGCILHFAKDAAEARRIVVSLAKERGVRSVTKSKSMITEEIDLNEALEAAGIRPVETDLGDWIVQISNEKPSHIIMPAIHKTREQIADLFTKRIHELVPAEYERLTAVARKELRAEFLQAGMGVSGVNFAVAETGTIVLVTNEGNGRMVTSLPPIHVAIMGIEKVIPTLDDLMILLKLLTRSATGQRISTYVSLITGPRRAGETDGPLELHIVILDNGRSAYLNSPLMEALFCIRCGACLNICPVYRKVGGHVYNTVYPGPIGLLVTPMHRGLGLARELSYASTLCGACHDICPVKIDIPRMILHVRNQAVERRVIPWYERVAFKGLGLILRSRLLYRMAAKLFSLLQRPFVRQGKISRIPLPPFNRWTERRDLPPVAQKTFRDRWRESQRGR